jgi:uncharacterized membrane protein
VTRSQDEAELQQEETPPEAPSDHPNPAIREIAHKDVSSGIAVAGHPIHAMMVHFPIALVICTLGIDVFYWWTDDQFWVDVSVWSTAGAFIAGVAAAMAGTAELLMVPGIRVRVASWNHAVVAMVLLAVTATNWGLRLNHPEQVLPHGLLLSLLASVVTAFAGFHGGKLVFDHGVGLIVSSKQ